MSFDSDKSGFQMDSNYTLFLIGWEVLLIKSWDSIQVCAPAQSIITGFSIWGKICLVVSEWGVALDCIDSGQIAFVIGLSCTCVFVV